MKKLLASTVILAALVASPIAANTLMNQSAHAQKVTYSISKKSGLVVMKGASSASINKQVKTFHDQEYKAFKKDYGSSKHASYNFGYKLLTNNKIYFSFKVTSTVTAADSSSTTRYYTVNKSSQKQVTMKDLLKQKGFKTKVNKAIKKQAKGTEFTSINANTQFYMNKNNQLVVSFDEGTIAPYSAGELHYTVNLK